MRFEKSALPLLLSGCSLIAVPCQAQDDDALHMSVSVKVWNASWAAAMPTVYTGMSASGAPRLVESLDNVEGRNKTAVFPVLALGKGKLIGTLSHARYTTDFRAPYSAVIGPNGMNIATSRDDHVVRKESDIALGYMYSPNISFTIGYKDASEERDTALGLGGGSVPNLEYKARALLFGGLGNFTIKGPLRFYGQLGYGPARIETSFADPAIPGANSNARYLISEMGLAYGLDIRDHYVKGASVSVGYRSQVVRTKGVAPAYRNQRDYRDTRDGIILALTVAI